MRLLFQTLVFSFIILINPISVFSCSCLFVPDPTFCESINVNHFIVEVVVINKPNSYDLEVNVLDEIALTIGKDTILILGQDGLNCGEEMSLFEVGDTLILGLNNFSINDAVNNEAYNWYLNGCDLNYLRIENGLVSGHIRNGLWSQTIDDFKNSIDDCIPTVSVANESIINDVEVYPNPFIDKLNFNTNEIINLSVEIYNIKGLLVFDKRLDSDNMELNLSELISGLYFIKISSNNQSKTFRVFKGK